MVLNVNKAFKDYVTCFVIRHFAFLSVLKYLEIRFVLNFGG